MYDVLGRLKNRGVVTVDESVTPAQFYPVPVDALIARLKTAYDTAFRELENELSLITPIPAFDLSWNLMGYKAVMHESARVLKSASKTAMLSVWPKEHTRLRPDIRAAESRGVKVVLSLFGAARAGSVRHQDVGLRGDEQEETGRPPHGDCRRFQGGRDQQHCR